jgi:3-deoxy-7-phosphoheptulonate synthase
VSLVAETATPHTRAIDVAGVTIGAGAPVVIAGPCAVESHEQTLEIAREVRAAGGKMLRGGAFKPRTRPRDFQGLKKRGLEILSAVREETGLPVVTEVMDARDLDLVARYADMLQIGSRNMQNYTLLREVGRQHLPVLLKRGMAATMKEWICAAEYISDGGNDNIVLCERGMRTPCTGEYDRNTLDLNVVEALRRETDLPVIVDPSHGTGRVHLVPPLAVASIAAGADGLLVEVIGSATERSTVLCDGEQGIRPQALRRIVGSMGLARRAYCRVQGE